MFATRERKSAFVKLFDKTPPGVRCPHFYELVLSNGCPYDCNYCYLRLTFRGRTDPVLFCNSWDRVRCELEGSPSGVYSTGELADSLAATPPLLAQALDWFSAQDQRYLLLVTKSVNLSSLSNRPPSPQVIVSFSVNSQTAAELYEHSAPDPLQRLEAATRLKDMGWRVRIRIDPIIVETGLPGYEEICGAVRTLEPEMVTVGTLRQYPGLHRFAREAPRLGLRKADDGRMRYPVQTRVAVYRAIARWLDRNPALCKETDEVWDALGWSFDGCNCTV